MTVAVEDTATAQAANVEPKDRLAPWHIRAGALGWTFARRRGHRDNGTERQGVGIAST